jgi:hypothetical protein
MFEDRAARAGIRPDACAYHVPRVPCFVKTCVRRSVYSGEMLERHRAVLDERDRFPVAFHRHHDVEARLAHFPDVALERGVGDLDDAARKAEIAHELDELS